MQSINLNNLEAEMKRKNVSRKDIADVMAEKIVNRVESDIIKENHRLNMNLQFFAKIQKKNLPSMRSIMKKHRTKLKCLGKCWNISRITIRNR